MMATQLTKEVKKMEMAGPILFGHSKRARATVRRSSSSGSTAPRGGLGAKQPVYFGWLLADAGLAKT